MKTKKIVAKKRVVKPRPAPLVASTKLEDYEQVLIYYANFSLYEKQQTPKGLKGPEALTECGTKARAVLEKHKSNKE